MKQFTLTNEQLVRFELDTRVEESVDAMFDFSGELKEKLQNAHTLTRVAVYKDEARNMGIDVKVPLEDFKASVKHLDKDAKAAIWQYRNNVIRTILLSSIIKSKVKIHKVAKDTMVKILHSILTNGQEAITLSQTIHNTSLKTSLLMNGVEVHTNMWMVDEIRLQFINELVELDYLDLRISNHTHMVSIPHKLSDVVEQYSWDYMIVRASLLAKKTIYLDPVPVSTKNCITTSSWYYQTPELAPDQIEVLKVLQSTKYEFVEHAEQLISEAYRNHLQVDTLPTWAIRRVEFFKLQIRASTQNGGHYVGAKFDSALRIYMMAEIGHLQTSPALKVLVRIAGIEDPVKYDMKNNVVQMYAVSTGIKSLAKPTCLVHPSEVTEDIRLQIAHKLNELLSIDVFNKDNIKPLFMVWAYNAGKRRLLDGVYTDEQEFFGLVTRTLKVPGLLELTGIDDEDSLWAVWTEVTNELVPAIVVLKKIFSKLTQANPFTETSWTLPDGATAQYASAVTNSKVLYWVSADGKLRQHTHYRKELEANAKAAGLLPRVIHSLDAYMARQIVIRAAMLGITVVPNHDSFTFDRVYLDILMGIVRELFIEIMEIDAFGSITKELNHKNVSLSMRDAAGKFITTDSFGDRLKATDIMGSFPMEFED